MSQALNMENRSELVTPQHSYENQVEIDNYIQQLAADIKNTQCRMIKHQAKQAQAYSLDMTPINFYSGLQRRNALRVPSWGERPWIYEARRQQQEELMRMHSAGQCDSQKCVLCMLAKCRDAQVAGPRPMPPEKAEQPKLVARAQNAKAVPWEKRTSTESTGHDAKAKNGESDSELEVSKCCGLAEIISFWESKSEAQGS